MTFSGPTNRAGLEEGATLDSEQVWSLLRGEPALPGVLFRGDWINSSALVLTVESVGDHSPVVGTFRVGIRPEAVLRDAANATVRSTALSPPLVGDWGRPPLPLLFSASDPDDGDRVSSAGDVLTITFDKPTNTPAVSSRRELDRLIEFSQVRPLDFRHPEWAPARSPQLLTTCLAGRRDSPDWHNNGSCLCPAERLTDRRPKPSSGAGRRLQRRVAR